MGAAVSDHLALSDCRSIPFLPSPFVLVLHVHLAKLVIISIVPPSNPSHLSPLRIPAPLALPSHKDQRLKPGRKNRGRSTFVLWMSGAWMVMGEKLHLHLGSLTF